MIAVVCLLYALGFILNCLFCCGSVDSGLSMPFVTSLKKKKNSSYFAYHIPVAVTSALQQ